MNRCWFIWLNSKQEGPFSYAELKADERLTPDTLVWKEGMADWAPIRKVPELNNLFKEEELEPEENEEDLSVSPITDEEIALPLQDEPPFLLWLLIALLVLIYVMIRLSQ